MKKQNLLQLFALLLMAISLVACSNDDDSTAQPDDEEEEITRVELLLTSATGFETYTIGSDTDEVVQINLEQNTDYTGALSFFNEDEVVTLEIVEESDEHLICLTPSDNNLTIERTDLDENDKEIGILSNWKTLGAGSGTITIKLKHQPDLKANNPGVNCDLGGTDVSVTFNYVVQ